MYSLTVGNKTYKAKTIKALLAETAKAIASGDSRIKELNTELKIKRGVIQPDTEADLQLPTVQPLSTEEAFQLSQDMLRPEGAQKAVRRYVEAEIGVPLDVLKNSAEAARVAAYKEKVFAAGKEFLQAHPEFVPSKANEEKMFAYMEQENILPISLKNYEIGYTRIKDTLDLRDPEAVTVTAPVVPVPPPVAPVPPAAPPAPVGRPRQASTGVAPRNSSVPTNATPTLPGIPGYPTRDQIERMSAKDMENHAIRLPKWQEHMELIYKK